MTDQEGFAHQDWAPVVLNPGKTTIQKKRLEQQKIINDIHAKSIKLDEDGNPIVKAPDTMIGHTIQQLRTQRKMTRADLAKKCNILENTLAQYENGKMAIPGKVKVVIAKALGVTTLNPISM